MNDILNAIDSGISFFSDQLWGWPLIILLFGTHLFLTFRLRFIQKYIFTAIKMSLIRTSEGAGEISHFGALTTALAATIGTGNIVGVGTAVAIGGPGAVLWMWLTGLFGIATKYAEALLSVKYRVHNPDGSYSGGPMYVMQHALKQKWMGVLFAVLTAVAAFGIGNSVQSNSIAVMVNETFNISPYLTGTILTILTAAVILGGIKSISRVCEALVPFMAAFYVLGCSILLIMHSDKIPQSLSLILGGAFTGTDAVAGGFIGAGIKEAIRFGVARGLFSNESGLGSAPIVAAAAQTKNPVRQALISSTGTFWDTVVVCAFTGLVIVNSGVWDDGGSGTILTKHAFNDLGAIGPVILTIGLLTFVFSTIIGWAYYGEKAIEFLAGKKAVLPYRVIWVVVVFIGSVQSLNTVWHFADLANGLMAIPNLITLILLSGVIVSETKKYLWENRLDETADDQH